MKKSENETYFWIFGSFWCRCECSMRHNRKGFYLTWRLKSKGPGFESLYQLIFKPWIESETCPCSQVYWKKAKIGSKSASAIQKIGRSQVELKVAVQNHILDKEAQFYPQAYQGEIRIWVLSKNLLPVELNCRIYSLGRR